MPNWPKRINLSLNQFAEQVLVKFFSCVSSVEPNCAIITCGKPDAVVIRSIGVFVDLPNREVDALDAEYGRSPYLAHDFNRYSFMSVYE